MRRTGERMIWIPRRSSVASLRSTDGGRGRSGAGQDLLEVIIAPGFTEGALSS